MADIFEQLGGVYQQPQSQDPFAALGGVYQDEPTKQKDANRFESIPEPSLAQKAIVGIGRGFVDLGEDAKQLYLKGTEAVGLQPEGTAAKYTKARDAERKFYESTPIGQSGIGEAARFITHILPYMLAPGGVAGGLIKRIGTGMLAGAGAGAAQYVPEEGSRALNTVFGGILGGALPLAGTAISKGYGLLKGGKDIVARNMLRGTDEAESLAAKQAAQRLGLNLTPAEASGSPIAAAAQGRLGTSKPGAQAMYDFSKGRLQQEQGIVKGFLDDVSSDSASAAEDVRMTAKEFIKSKKDALMKKAKPLYEKAFIEDRAGKAGTLRINASMDDLPDDVWVHGTSNPNLSMPTVKGSAHTGIFLTKKHEIAEGYTGSTGKIITASLDKNSKIFDASTYNNAQWLAERLVKNKEVKENLINAGVEKKSEQIEALAKEIFDSDLVSEPNNILEQLYTNNILKRNGYKGIKTITNKGDEILKVIDDSAINPFYSEKINVKESGFKLLPDDKLDQLKQSNVISQAIKDVIKVPAYADDLANVPENSIKYLDYTKRHIDDQITEARRAGKDNLVRLLTKQKEKLVSSLDEASPDYAAARAIYGEGAKPIEKLNNSELGKIANLTDLQLKNISKTIFDPSQTDIKVLNRLRDGLNKQNPETWNRIVRNEMERRLDTAGNYAGSAFYGKILKSDRSFNQFLTALKGNPLAQQKLIDMRSSFKNLIEPVSAKTAARLAKSSLDVPRSSWKEAMITFASNILGGKYDQAAIKFITSNDWDKGYQAVKKIQNRSERAAKLGALLGKISATEAAQLNNDVFAGGS